MALIFLPYSNCSVLAQTAPVKSIVVVDDSSTDDTREVAERHGVRYERVDVRSPIKAREAGFRATGSEFICFLDADDVLPPQYLETGLAAFGEQTGIVYSDFERFGNFTGRRELKYDPERLYRNNMLHAGSIARRAALEAADAFNRQPMDVIHHDWALWRPVLEQGWGAAKNSTPYLYRAHGTNMTTDVAARVIADQGFYVRGDLANETITLAIPLSGRSTWPALSTWLDLQSWPHEQTRLILLDTSGNRRFGRNVRSWAANSDYPDVRYAATRVARPGLADLDRKQNSRAVQLAMVKIYNRIRNMAAEGEYLWIIEDDIVPPNDAAEKLLRKFDHDVASVSGAYRSRFYDGYVAGKLDSSGALTEGTGVVPVRYNGFGCVMLRLSVVRQQVFTHRAAIGGDYDRNFYDWLSRRRDCNRALLDWSCRCEHVGA